MSLGDRELVFPCVCGALGHFRNGYRVDSVKQSEVHTRQKDIKL